MDQFPQVNAPVEQFKQKTITAWRAVRRLFSAIWRAITNFGMWLRIRLPFVEAIIRRGAANPATIFTDLAVFILSLYVIFGLIGSYLVYKAHSESRFTETLALLYPMPAARVNDNIIWAHEFLVRVRYINTFNAQTSSNAGAATLTQDQIRTQVLDGLMQNQILVNEAKKRGVIVTNQNITNAYNKQKAQTQDLDSQVKKLYGMNVSDFKQILAEQILRQKVESVAVEQIHVLHILTSSPDAANLAENDLKNGMSFSDAAKKYSQDAQTKNSGGDLGYWTKGELANQIAQNFEDTAFDLALNTPSAPIQTKYGYHIIEVTGKTGSNYESFNDWLSQTTGTYTTVKYLH